MPNHITNRVHLFGDAEKIRELLEAVRYDDGELGTLDFNRLILMPEELDIAYGSSLRLAVSTYLSAINPQNADFPYPDKMDVEQFTALAKKLDRYNGAGHFQTNLTPQTYTLLPDGLTDMLKLGSRYVGNFQKYHAFAWYDFRVREWGSKWNSYDSRPLENDTLTFCTAWSRVLPVIAELAKRFPEVEIEYEWADEDIGCNVGHAHFQDGELTEDVRLDAQTKEAYEFAAEVIGADLSEWGLVFDEKSQNYVYRGESEDEAEEEHLTMN